ncbi:hypothetical protein FACS1894211_01280 [Clostridia bacterium]|nr:hypothetical protein FACS1894211_01280 [Clostridia bacterium]
MFGLLSATIFGLDLGLPEWALYAIIGAVAGILLGLIVYLIWNGRSKAKRRAAEKTQPAQSEAKPESAAAAVPTAHTVSDKTPEPAPAAFDAARELAATVVPAVTPVGASAEKSKLIDGMSYTLVLRENSTRDDDADYTEDHLHGRFFTLSRADVFDRLEDMAANEQRFSQPVIVQKRKKSYLPDYLFCGDRLFGMIWQKRKVLKFTLRLDDEGAQRLKKEHVLARRPVLAVKGDWMEVVVDSTFDSKEDACALLKKAYYHTLLNHAEKEGGQEEFQSIDAIVRKKAETTADEALISVAAEHARAVKEFRTSAGAAPDVDLNRIAAYERKRYGAEIEVTIQEGAASSKGTFKTAGQTYAVIAERKGKLSMRVRLNDVTGRGLQRPHPESCRTLAPKERGWYFVPVDGTFPLTGRMYKLLASAKLYTERFGKS